MQILAGLLGSLFALSYMLRHCFLSPFILQFHNLLMTVWSSVRLVLLVMPALFTSNQPAATAAIAGGVAVAAYLDGKILL